MPFALFLETGELNKTDSYSRKGRRAATPPPPCRHHCHQSSPLRLLIQSDVVPHGGSSIVKPSAFFWAPYNREEIPRRECSLWVVTGTSTTPLDPNDSLYVSPHYSFSLRGRPLQVMAKSSDRSSGFRFAIDRGGTFTDVYAELPGESPPFGIRPTAI